MQKETTSQRKTEASGWKWFVLGETILIVVILSVLSAGRELWYDEAFSVCLARCSFADILSYTASDVHPPLYYFALKIFTMIFGQSLFAYRVLSALPFALMLLAAERFCRKYFSGWEMVVCIPFLTGVPSMLLYASEIRMYTGCQLFVMMSMILAVDLVQTPSWKKWLGFSIVNALAAYTHYFAGAAVLLISAFLLAAILWQKKELPRRVLHWISAMAVTGILYLPWLFVFYRQLKRVKEDYWISPFDWGELKEYVQFVFGYPDAAVTVIFGIVLKILALAAVVVLIRGWRHQKKDYILAMNLGVFYAYIALGVLLSVCITPVFMRRYIIIVLPLFWLAVICILFQVKNKKLMVIIGCIGWALLSVSFARELQHRNSEANVTAVSLLEQECERDDVLYCTSPYVMAEMAVYFPQNACYIPEIALEGEAFTRWDEMAGCVITEHANAFCEEQHEVVWLLSYKDQEDCAELFAEQGYQVTEKGKQTLGWGNGKKDSITVRVYRCELAHADETGQE